MAIATRAAFDDLLDELADDGRLVHVEHLAPRAERAGQLRRPLPAPVAAALGDLPLWSHQAEAIDLLRDGHNVVIATGTASGKSRSRLSLMASGMVSLMRPSISE